MHPLVSPIPPLDRASLERLGRRLAASLGGTWHQNGALCHCPVHSDTRPSLSIRAGRQALLFKCFGGCATRDVLAAIRLLDNRVLTRCIPSRTDHRATRTEWLQARARTLWEEARPLENSRAAEYLRRRGIRGTSEALRFHPRTPIGPVRDQLFLPAMLAEIRNEAGCQAILRTYLTPDRETRTRGAICRRRILGHPEDGAVRLGHATGRLALAEGIETALAAMQIMDLPVWASLGSERLYRIAIPKTVQQLILLPDNDRAGILGAARAAIAHARPGRTIDILYPPPAMGDWNDLLLAGEEVVERWVRSRA